MGYDGIQGFATQLRNRISEPPTPQRRSSPRQVGRGETSSAEEGSQTRKGRAPLGQNLNQGGEGSPGASTIRETPKPVGTPRLTQVQPPPSSPRQLLVYDETPAGRPLPTLRDIRQANLRRVLEEEGAETPCDICGAPTMIIGLVRGANI